MDCLSRCKLLNKEMHLVAAKKALKEKDIIVYYFTASWVTSHSNLTAKLQDVYNYSRDAKRKLKMEVVYVSFDTETEDFEKDFLANHGNWLALPCQDVATEVLRYTYTITNLPTIIVVKANGDIISRSGRKELEELGLNVIITWSDNSSYI